MLSPQKKEILRVQCSSNSAKRPSLDYTRKAATNIETQRKRRTPLFNQDLISLDSIEGAALAEKRPEYTNQHTGSLSE